MKNLRSGMQQNLPTFKLYVLANAHPVPGKASLLSHVFPTSSENLRLCQLLLRSPWIFGAVKLGFLRWTLSLFIALVFRLWLSLILVLFVFILLGLRMMRLASSFGQATTLLTSIASSICGRGPNPRLTASPGVARHSSLLHDVPV